MRKEWIINGSLAVGSLIVFILAVEFGLRITGLQTVKPNPPKIYVTDTNPNISYKLKPNLQKEPAYKATVSTDQHGFRQNSAQGTVYSHQSTVILGDSVAFGYGVNDSETLPAQLEKRICQLPTANCQFINAAVPGYQLQQERALYETYVKELNPEAVMIVFFWNDLDGLAPGILDSDGILRASSWKPEDDHRPWLERHSAFYKAFHRLLSLKTSKEVQQDQREHAEEENISRVYLQNYLNDLNAFAKTLPEKRYIVIWPDNFFHTEIRSELITKMQGAGFTVIDLYELFGNDVETLLWDTVHPSPKAIEGAAEFIVEQM